MTVQQMILKLRELGKSQTTIAKEVGTNQSTISRIENGLENFSYQVGKNIEVYYGKVIAESNPSEVA